MLPPVMGVAAFLMADILGIPYLQVVQAGTIPALLFYLSVSVSVYLIVIKHGWVASQEGKFDTSVLWSGVHFAIPFGVLLYCLIIMKLTPLSAGLYTIFSLIPVMFIRDLIVEDTSLTTVRSTTEKTLTGMRDGAVDFAPLIGALAGIGFVIAMVEQTGLAQRISYSMVTFAGGSVFVLLIFAMIASILFGLGMPTPAAYLMVVVLIAPALTNAGIIELKAHIFVFYFAMLSAITPPVAVAVLIGARIAEADFLQSCLQALRIGIAGFIIPFALVYNDGLIVWSYPTTLISLGALLVGLLGVTTAVIGFDGVRDIKLMWRVVIGAGGILALFGPGTIQYAGCVGVILLLVLSTRGVFEAPRPTPSR
jgi:TRAP transporter 4TM/12TM fusion protein